MLSDLVGKRFELTEVVEADGGGLLSSVTLVGDDEAIRIEGVLVDRYSERDAHMRASIEQLSDPVDESQRPQPIPTNTNL